MDVTFEEKAVIVARHVPCDHCSCQGWHALPPLAQYVQQIDQLHCDCGHGLLDHVNNLNDVENLFPLALRIKDILQENGKEDDCNYTNNTIQDLHRQILESAQKGTVLSEASQPSTLNEGGLCPKRERQEEEATGCETKRQKMDMYDQGKDEQQERSDTYVISRNKNDHETDVGNGQVDTCKLNQQMSQGTPTKSAPENDTLPSSLATHGDSSNEEAAITSGSITKDGDGDNDDSDVSAKLLENGTLLDKKDQLTLIEKRKGDIVTKIVVNDGKPENLIYLTGLKNIFQKQLPMMPKEYITRLVYDRNHCCIALIRRPLKVIGGICYRPFDEQDFAEIVFCAVSSTEQVRGYGAHLMNYLKDYVTTHTLMRHFLTYADNSATGYFRKQGFTTEITLDRRKWVGFIKDYEGGTIMQCTVTPDVDYLQEQKALEAQQQIGQISTSRGLLSGLEMQMDDMDPLSVSGVREASNISDMDLSIGTKHPPHYLQMRQLVLELQNHANSWPFRKPVNGEEVADYYQVIRNPMDLSTLEQNVNGDVYTTMDDFVMDVQKIFDNCRTYNPEGTVYAKCAALLEQYFNERVQVWSGSTS